MSDEEYNVLQRLKEQFNSSSDAETIRNGLAIINLWTDDELRSAMESEDVKLLKRLIR